MDADPDLERPPEAADQQRDPDQHADRDRERRDRERRRLEPRRQAPDAVAEAEPADPARAAAADATSAGVTSGSATRSATPSTNPAGCQPRPSVQNQPPAAASTARPASASGRASERAVAWRVKAASSPVGERRARSSAGTRPPASAPADADQRRQADDPARQLERLDRLQQVEVRQGRADHLDVRGRHPVAERDAHRDAEEPEQRRPRRGPGRGPGPGWRRAPAGARTRARRRTSMAEVASWTRNSPTNRLMRLSAVRLSRKAPRSPAAWTSRSAGVSTRTPGPSRARSRAASAAASTPGRHADVDLLDVPGPAEEPLRLRDVHHGEPLARPRAAPRSSPPARRPAARPAASRWSPRQRSPARQPKRAARAGVTATQPGSREGLAEVARLLAPRDAVRGEEVGPHDLEEDARGARSSATLTR